jgi:release factor glutamine methyltransferase
MAEAREGATLGALLRETRAALEGAGIANAAHDARILVEELTGTNRADSIASPELQIEPAKREAVADAIQRRIAGEPVHRILGHREFYGLDLALSPATLEPRPDTEVLVDRVVPHLRAIVRAQGECRILDLGTGTGAIGLALLAQISEATAVGVDIDPRAVETARLNAARNGLSERFQAVVSDWFSDVIGKFHAIVSNPPYIDTQEMASLPREVRLFDPEKALHGGPDGLEAYRAIAIGASARLEPRGVVAVEIGYRQCDSVTGIFESAGFELTETARDLAGRDRVVLVRRQPEVAS